MSEMCCECEQPAERSCPDCGKPICANHSTAPMPAILEAVNGGPVPTWKCPLCGAREAVREVLP